MIQVKFCGPRLRLLALRTTEHLAPLLCPSLSPACVSFVSSAPLCGLGHMLSPPPAPHTGEAVFARCLSSLKDERIQASKKLKGPQKVQFKGDKKSFLEDIRKVRRCPWEGGGNGAVSGEEMRPQGGDRIEGSFLGLVCSLFPPPCPCGVCAAAWGGGSRHRGPCADAALSCLGAIL